MCSDPVPSFTRVGTEDIGVADLSIAVGSDGLGLIAFRDTASDLQDLKIAHCDDLSCSSSTITTVDASGTVGLSASLTIGSDGFGLISYFEGVGGSDGNLKVAHCNNAACTSATVTTLENNVGFNGSAVTLGGDGKGLIAYFDGNTNDLKVAHCENVICTSATSATIDSVGDVGRDPSIVAGTDGLGLISYIDSTNQSLKVAHCDDASCSSATISVLDSTLSQSTFVNIGSDGLGLISYHGGGDLKVAHCDNASCTSASARILHKGGTGSWDTSIAIGADGLPMVSYGSFFVAHCLDVTCDIATKVELPGGETVQHRSAITTGQDGLALLAFRGSGTDLWVMHCANELCTY